MTNQCEMTRSISFLALFVHVCHVQEAEFTERTPKTAGHRRVGSPCRHFQRSVWICRFISHASQIKEIQFFMQKCNINVPIPTLYGWTADGSFESCSALPAMASPVRSLRSAKARVSRTWFAQLPGSWSLLELGSVTGEGWTNCQCKKWEIKMGEKILWWNQISGN